MRTHLLVALFVAVVLAGCSSQPDGTEAYCAAVERNELAMADPTAEPGSAEHTEAVAVKRAAMAQLRDLAPAEIRDDWDVWFEPGAADSSARDVARANVASFEAEHC